MSEINVLIVEDESIVAMGLEQDLKKLGYQISDVVSNGLDAIEKAGKNNPDIVLMDIKLEGDMDGIQAAETIRKQFMIPVVYLTAYADEETIQRAKITEPYGYIVKPYQEREIHSAIEMGIYKHKIEKEMRIKDCAIESSISAIAIGSTDGKITYVNDAFKTLWRCEQSSKIIGKPFTSLWNQEENTKSLVNIIEKKGNWKGEACAQRHDGSSFIGQICIHFVSDENKKAFCWMLTCIDITEKKTLELESTKTKRYLENLLDSASEMIISFDGRNRITTWNKTAEQITGFKKNEVINRKISRLDVFHESENVEQSIEKFAKGENMLFDEMIVFTKRGDKRVIKVSHSVIKGMNGEKGVLLVGNDITNEIEMHNKLLSGRSYYVSKDAIDVKSLLSNLSHFDYDFFCCIRPHSPLFDFIKTVLDAKFCLLSDDAFKANDQYLDSNILISEAIEFCNSCEKPFIIFDDIHYFLIKYSFELFARTLLRFNDIIAKTNAFLLVLSEDALFDERQKTLLKQELYTLPTNSIEHVYIDDNVRGMLAFIHEQNEINASVSFKKIMSEFDIVYATAAKRVEELEKNQFITVKHSGKAKRMYISEKGISFLQKVHPI